MDPPTTVRISITVMAEESWSETTALTANTILGKVIGCYQSSKNKMNPIRRGRGLLTSGPARHADAQKSDNRDVDSTEDPPIVRNLSPIQATITEKKKEGEVIMSKKAEPNEEPTKKSSIVSDDPIKSSPNSSSMWVRGARGRGLFSASRGEKKQPGDMQAVEKKEATAPVSSSAVVGGISGRGRGRGLFSGSQRIGDQIGSNEIKAVNESDTEVGGQRELQNSQKGGEIQQIPTPSIAPAARGGFARGRGRLAFGVLDRRNDMEANQKSSVETTLEASRQAEKIPARRIFETPRQSGAIPHGVTKPGFGRGFGPGASSSTTIISGLTAPLSGVSGLGNVQTGKVDVQTTGSNRNQQNVRGAGGVVALNPNWDGSDDENTTPLHENTIQKIAAINVMQGQPALRGAFGRGRGTAILANRSVLGCVNQNKVSEGSSQQFSSGIKDLFDLTDKGVDQSSLTLRSGFRMRSGSESCALGENLGGVPASNVPIQVSSGSLGSFNLKSQSNHKDPNRSQAFDQADDIGDRNRNRPTCNREPAPAAQGESELRQPYLPLTRSVEEIIQEDIEQRAYYETIADGDENVKASFTGFSSQHKNIVAIDTWKDSGLEDKLYQNIERCQYVRPRKIQAYAIPLILEGCDLKGLAETGSGKTAAFMVPIVNIIMRKKLNSQKPTMPTPSAIIVEPTRELCKQVYEQGLKFANGVGVNVAKAYGQFDSRLNRRELQDCGGCDILCVTPGRFMHLVCDNWIDYTKVNILVLDEADRLMELSFLETIRKVIRVPGFPQKEVRQTLMFSATFPEEVQKLANEVMKVEFAMIAKDELVAANNKIKQEFILVDSKKKRTVLLELLKRQIDKAVEDGVEIPRFLVFVSRKKTADALSIYLSMQGLKATTINADRNQSQRELALRQFILKDMYVLISTDVCSRGIDIKNMDHVINYDLPDFKGQNPKNPDDKTYDERPTAYVQRIGRTGRLRAGTAISFFDALNENDRELADKLVNLVRGVGQEPPEFLTKTAQDYARVSSFVPPDDPWGDDEEDDGSPAIPISVHAGVVNNIDDWD